MASRATAQIAERAVGFANAYNEAASMRKLNGIVSQSGNTLSFADAQRELLSRG